MRDFFRRAELYGRIRALRAKGHSLRAVARAAGVSVKRVIRYLGAGQCPNWNSGRRRPTQLDAFAPQVEVWIRWGGRNAAEPYRGLGEQGYRASYDAVRRFVSRRQGSTGCPGRRAGLLTPLAAWQLSFAFIRRQEDRTEEQQRRVEQMQAGDSALPEGLRLAASLAALVRKTARDRRRGECRGGGV